MAHGLTVGEYQGEIVAVRKMLDKTTADVIVKSAKQIMGLELARGRWLDDDTYEPPEFLTPPKEGSETWLYATRILRLEQPFLEVWRIAAGCSLVVSAKDVTNIHEV